MIRKEEIIKASVAYNERNGKIKVFGGSNILSNEEYFAFNRNPDFIAGAKWADENPDGKMLLHVLNKGVKQGKREMLDTLWKSADGDDLPEIDREVIALVWENEHYKVVFAHRPQEYWDGRNIDTGEVTRYYPKRYDKGGWNIPDVKWWLDLDLPKMEE